MQSIFAVNKPARSEAAAAATKQDLGEKLHGIRDEVAHSLWVKVIHKDKSSPSEEKTNAVQASVLVNHKTYFS